jgi:hypothetical protein
VKCGREFVVLKEELMGRKEEVEEKRVQENE